MKTLPCPSSASMFTVPTAARRRWGHRLCLLLAVSLLLGVAASAQAQAPGNPDAGFNPTADHFISTVAVQANGKILIGGGFSQVDGTPRQYLARLNSNGTLDTTFNPRLGDYGVFALAVQSNGQVLIGGSFTQIEGVARTSLARLNPDGTVDSTYNASAEGSVYALTVQPNGKVVIGGNFTKINGMARSSVARLNTDGSLDVGFDNASADNSVNTVVVQPDGKILLGGDFTHVDGVARSGVARLNTDGSLDTGFNAGVNGVVDTVTLQSDGKILLGGRVSQVNGVPGANVARLNANGGTDPGFNASTDGEVSSVVLQTDGKVIVAGGFSKVNGMTHVRAARLNADGSLDNGFDVSLSDDVLAAAVQSDGKILLVGAFLQVNGAARSYVVRLLGGTSVPAPVITSATSASAQVNQPFRYQILATNSPTGYAAPGLPPGLSVDPATGLISGTPTQTGTTSVQLSATNAAGTGNATLALTVTAAPVPAPVITGATAASAQVGRPFTFQISATNHPTSFDAAGLPTGLSVNPASGLIDGTPTVEGSFSVTQSATNAGGTGFRILTLNIAAAPVLPPVITSPTSAGAQAGRPFAFQVSASNNPTSFAAAGLPPGLSLDVTNGQITGTPTAPGVFPITLNATNAGGTGAAANLTLTVVPAPTLPPVITSADRASAQVGQPFSYQIAASNQPTSFGATGLPAGLRLDAISGLVTGTLSDPGVFPTVFSAVNGGGTGSLAFNLTVLERPATGGLFSSFDPAGGVDGTVRAIVFQPDGRALIGGAFSSYRGMARAGIARVNPDGTLDSTFDPGSGTDDTVDAILVLPNGQVLIGGSFTSVNGNPRNGVARLNADGSLDLSFDAGVAQRRALARPGEPVRRAFAGIRGGGPRGAAVNVDRLVSSLALQPNGGIIMAGAFQSIANSVAGAVARLTGNGTLDTAFQEAAAGGADAPVNSAVVQADGSVIIGGEFSMAGGVPRGELARLNPDGSPDLSFDPGPGIAGGPINSVALTADGSVLIGGDFAQVGGLTRTRIARVRANGSVDPGFDAGQGANAAVLAVAALPNGQVLAAGAFSKVAGLAQQALARLNANGTLDLNFQAQADAPVAALALTPDGQAAVLGGDFRAVNATPRNGLALISTASSAPGALPVVTVTATAPSVTEGGISAKFLLTRTGGDISVPLTVFYNASPNDGTDYKLFSGSATILAGTDSVKVKLKAFVDGLAEGPEPVKLKVLPGQGYTVGAPRKATIMILDAP